MCFLNHEIDSTSRKRKLSSLSAHTNGRNRLKLGTGKARRPQRDGETPKKQYIEFRFIPFVRISLKCSLLEYARRAAIQNFLSGTTGKLSTRTNSNQFEPGSIWACPRNIKDTLTTTVPTTTIDMTLPFPVYRTGPSFFEGFTNRT